MKKMLSRRETALHDHVEQHEEAATRFEAAQQSLSAKVSTLQSKLRVLRHRFSDSSSVQEEDPDSSSNGCVGRVRRNVTLFMKLPERAVLLTVLFASSGLRQLLMRMPSS